MTENPAVDPAVLTDFRRVLADAVTAGARIRRRDRDHFRDIGRRAAAQGVPLPVLVDAYLSELATGWPGLPEVTTGTQAQIRGAGQSALRAGADGCTALAEGYALARREFVREQLAQRRDFVEELLLGGAHGLASLVDRAGRFGLDLAGGHVVAIVRAEQPFTDGAAATRQIEGVMLAGAGVDVLVATRGGELVVVGGAPDRAAAHRLIELLAGSLPDPAGGVRLSRAAPVGSWRMGVGRPHPGPAGVRLSHQEAVEALVLGEKLHGFGGLGPVFDSAELDVPRVLIRDEAAMWDLIRSVLAPLARARSGAAPLLTTLDAYFAAGGNASAAARALHLSPRAMTYRLARIAELTGHDPADPQQSYALHTALLGARLLGWPGQIAETMQS